MIVLVLLQRASFLVSSFGGVKYKRMGSFWGGRGEKTTRESEDPLGEEEGIACCRVT